MFSYKKTELFQKSGFKSKPPKKPGNTPLSGTYLSFLDINTTVSTCVVARIGTHGFSLVRSMGTQNSRGVVLLAILAKRLEILAVHTVFEPGLVNKDNHVGVFVPITIITAHDYFLELTTLIISKKPGNTGISRDIRTEFTTDLLLSD